MKKMNNKKQNNEGFTLVELIIVVAIIALLIAMIAPNLQSFLGTASDTTIKANAKTVYTTTNAWLTEMRVEKKAVNAGNITITNGTVSFASGMLASGDTTSQASFTATLNTSEMDGATVTIVVNDNYGVDSVTWADGSGSTATYPEAAAAGGSGE